MQYTSKAADQTHIKRKILNWKINMRKLEQSAAQDVKLVRGARRYGRQIKPNISSY